MGHLIHKTAVAKAENTAKNHRYMEGVNSDRLKRSVASLPEQ